MELKPQSFFRLLQISSEELESLLFELPSLYRRFPLDKGNGKQRWIEAPLPRLKRLQRRLHRHLLCLQPHSAAHGFVRGRSIVTHARLHVGQACVLSLDLQDFFGSTTRSMVERALAPFRLESAEDKRRLLDLVLRNHRLPQGAPTSPHLANLAFFPADLDLSAVATEQGLNYSRYADDLTFSGPQLDRTWLHPIRNILHKHGYRLAEHKTRLLGQHQRQMVTGLVVNERLSLPRPLRRWLRALQHDIRKRGLQAALQDSRAKSPDQIQGYAALLRHLHPQRFQQEVTALLELLR